MVTKGITIVLIFAVYFWLTGTSTYTDTNSDIKLKHHIRLTAGASSGDDLPIIIALHGNGDTYDNFYEYTLKDLDVPARIVLIEAPKKYWPYDPVLLNQYSSAIASFSEDLNNEYTPTQKPMLFGFSGGGVVAYYSALTQCDSYSVVVPVSGMLKSDMIPSSINMSNRCNVMAFHGKTDSVVSFASGKFAIDELQKHSKNVALTAFDGGHHGVAQDFKIQILSSVGDKL